METKGKQFHYFLMFLLFSLLACEKESIFENIQPDKQEEPEKIIYLQVSDWLVCPSQEINLSIKNEEGEIIDRNEVKFYLIPEIGTIDLQSGKYISPDQIEEPIRVEILAEYNKDKNVKSGKSIYLRPHDPKSFVLTRFSGIDHAIDSGQLPDGNLVFASNNPVEPPLINGMFDFEIFCTDLQGNLIWHTNLGNGILQRIFVSQNVIYGIGYHDGYVVVQFDFQGKLLAKKYLEIEQVENHLINESMSCAVNESDEFVCMLSHANGSAHSLFKFDKDLNLMGSKSIAKSGNRLIDLGNTGYLLTGLLNGDFEVVDSNLAPLWSKKFNPNAGSTNGVVEKNAKLEIWTIIRELHNNEVILVIHNTYGNQISTKRLPFSEKLFFNQFYGVKQFQNGDIWLVASSQDHSFEKPYFENEYVPNLFHLIKLSFSGEILEQAWIERLNFLPPHSPGGWPLKFFDLYQGREGLLLSGKWYNNFLIQLNPDNSFSPC